MQRTFLLLSLAALAAPTTAQLSVVTPPNYGTAVGNSNNIYPWGRGNQSMRFQQVYDSSNFTLQGITAPVLIQGMKYRPYPGATTSWAGGSWPNIRIDLASCPNDYLSASSVFASNLDIDVQTVLTGPVTITGGSTMGAGVVVPSHIDIQFTTPFLYDPNLGKDLTVDVYLDGTGWTGSTRALDVVSGAAAGALGTRIYDTSGMSGTSGTVGTEYTLICEFSFVPPSGYAVAASYGTGCIDRAGATFYETFPPNTFDLANTSLSLLPSGSGYVVLTGSNTWWTPVGTNLGLTDDSVSAALPLGFTLNYPGGSTTDVYASSNGFVWAQPSTDNGCCDGNPGSLRGAGARWSALWNDLNPASAGTVVFDQDPTNGAAYLTYTGVPEYGTTNLNSFQFAFFSNGAVEIRWQGCTVANHTVLAGWSPGGGAKDPGSVDISTSLPIVTTPDIFPLAHSASARPVLGSTITLNTTNVPMGTVIGTTLFGLAEWNPGLPLAGLGMPGCFQYLSIDASAIWFPVGSTGSTVFPLPSSIGFAGVQVKTQSAALVPGINALGAITSNGVRLTLDQN
jgi:hypothetical protein